MIAAVFGGQATAIKQFTGASVSERAAAAQQAAMAQMPSVSSAPGPAPVGDLVDTLTRLADLHDRGVLTDEEFQAQKKRILGE
ncbi:MAG: SHOCT domain-containing protein [Actinomycetota bacterium]|nr:SHOCT domain-containing protein [Actinomycetota bacterium]